MPEDTFSFADEELLRYQRQTVLPGIGLEGQRRLKKGRVLLVGAGGLGSPAAMYLAAAGVGTLGIADGDPVELGNLQRQVIHSVRDLGMAKPESARKWIRDLNPNTTVECHNHWLDDKNAVDIVRGYDLVLGCVDNFAARYLINDACVRLGIANVFGAAARFEGQASVFSHDGGPCYRCFFRDPPDENRPLPPSEKGVLGTVPGTIGCIQANEAIKLLLGVGRTLSGRLLLFDALAMRFREIPLKRDPCCPICGTASTEAPAPGRRHDAP